MKSPSIVLLLVGLFFALNVFAQPDENYGKIELLRDRWGIAHVFSDTDAGAMYGLGYAQAEDRFFQMNYFLRTIQGRLAEVIGDVPTNNGRTRSLEEDRKMRTIGFYRAAQEVVKHLDPESLAFLQAFSEGVNDYREQNQGRLCYLFEKTGLTPEPWTPADSIALWWHCAQWFASDGLRDRIVTDFSAAQTAARGFRVPVDDDAAVVKREDVTETWIDEVNAFMREKGLQPRDLDPDDPPKFSHAWVVGGKLSTTGSAMLMSDPQTPVWNPSFLYEFHVSGKTFNARGTGVAGSPIILIGFNRFVSWGMTALGADQADLFIYQTNPDHPDQYRYDGQWRAMKKWDETIRIKDAEPESITIRETHHGPIVTAFIRNCPDGWEAAVRRVPICETDRETIQGAIGMMRAKTADEFAAALPRWRFPTANVIFGDRDGNIGYWSLGALPVRSAKSPAWGSQAHDGSSSEWEWQGMVPYHLLPHVMNPKRGYLVSANHRTIQSFYQLTMGTSTGSAGDSSRGLRIKEKIAEHLDSHDQFTPEDVLAVEYDGVNPSKREILRIGYFLRDTAKDDLSEPTLRALDYLEDWYKNGAHSFNSVRGTELVNQIRFIFRGNVFSLVSIYGGGDSGLARFAKTIAARAKNPDGFFVTPEEKNFVNTVLGNAWRGAVNQYGENPDLWFDLAGQAAQRQSLGYFTSLEQYPSLDPAQDVDLPKLEVTDGNTIWSQRAQAYSQFVPLHDADAARTINPVGISERPNSPYRFSTYSDWAKGRLNPAPLSLAKVDEIAVEKRWLAGGPQFPNRRRAAARVRDRTDAAAPDEVETLPGRRPDDPQLESSVRFLLRATNDEAESKIREIEDYIEGDDDLTRQAISVFRLVVYLQYGSDFARERMKEAIIELGGELPPERPERFILRQRIRQEERQQETR